MDYSKIYIELIERAVDRVLNGYLERHHVIPRCMGGDNKPRNIVDLTPEEHYLAHLLLVKIYPNNDKLIFAANMMGKTRISNKVYGWLRKKHSQVSSERMKNRKVSDETREKHSKNRRGKTHSNETKKKISESAKNLSDETRVKMSKSQLGNKNSLGTTPWNKGGGKCSEKTRAKMSESGKNRAPLSRETKLKISESTKGKSKKPFTDETKKKMSESAKKRIRSSFSDEVKLKMSESARNRRPVSEETRKKNSESAKRSWEKRKERGL